MTKRNRSDGWTYAKISGHTNEDLVKKLLDTDINYRTNFLTRLGMANNSIISTSVGGIHETNVDGILGKKTKSKTDLKVCLNNGNKLNISIKKSLSGQVYLIKADSFIKIFNKRFEQSIPSDVQRAIKLFWSASDDANEIIQQYADKSNNNNYNSQLKHNSLNATTLKKYNKELYNSLLLWFSNNIYELTKLSFAMGAAVSKDTWADYVWYINLLGDYNIDCIFNINTLCYAAQSVAKTETYYGDKNGGTTIQLPFGFVQWHQQKMQFHHSYEKISKLINNL